MKNIFLLVCFIGIYLSSQAQFPMVVYNSSGSNINVRATPSTSGTFLCTVAPNKRLVAISQSGSWYEVYIPINGIGSPTTAWVSAGTGYMLPDNNAAQVQLTASSVLIRKTAGGTGYSGTLWAYYPGYSYEYAATAVNQRYYPTGNIQSISGTTWYEIDVPRSCYQCNNGSCTVSSDFSIVTLGWISGQYLNYISPCSYSISPSSQTYNASAGSGSFSVTAGSGCAWSASSNCGWINLINSSGSGNGSVTFNIDENTTTTQRSCTITLGSQTYTVTQSGAASCTYSISPSTQNHTATGGNGSFGLTTGTFCQWSASVSCNWVHLTSSSGTGSSTINYTVDANTFSNSRNCFITVNGQTYTVTQDGVGSNCNYTLSPANNTYTSGAGSGSFTVNVTPSFCTWTATESCSWVTLSNNSFGTGNGTVTFSYDANTLTTARSCDIEVNGQTFTLTQQGTTTTPCNPPLSPPQVTANGCSFVAQNISGVTYQWYLNGNIIPNATSRFFTPTTSGYYYVVITDANNCTAQSVDVYCPLGISDVIAESFSVSPNPSNGSFTVSFETEKAETIQLKVYDLLGQLVKQESPVTVSGTYTQQINLTQMPKGIYLLQIKAGEESISKRIEIQ